MQGDQRKEQIGSRVHLFVTEERVPGLTVPEPPSEVISEQLEKGMAGKMPTSTTGRQLLQESSFRGSSGQRQGQQGGRCASEIFTGQEAAPEMAFLGGKSRQLSLPENTTNLIQGTFTPKPVTKNLKVPRSGFLQSPTSNRMLFHS